MPALPLRQSLAAGLLVAAPLVLSVALPGALLAQTVLTVSPQLCVWHAGDDPDWATPSLDESGWQPYTQWKLDPRQPHYWVRCHTDLSLLQTLEHPAIQVTLYAAYQVYLDGVLIGEAGNLQSGFFNMDAIRSFPVPATHLDAQPVTLALRISYRYSDFAYGSSRLRLPTPVPFFAAILAGESSLLRQRRADAVLNQIPAPFAGLVCFGLIGVLGFALLGQFLQDRSRRDLLMLSMSSVSVAAIYVHYFSASALLDSPIWANFGVFAAAAIVDNVSRTCFFFSVAGRRVSLLFWIVLGLALPRYALVVTGLFLPLDYALWLSDFLPRLATASAFATAALGVAPFVAFWPYRGIPRSKAPLVLLCMAWGAGMTLFFASQPAAGLAPMLGLAPGVLLRWHEAAIGIQAFVTASVLVALMGLLSRDQQRTARERAELAGEMASAREVQQYLIPETLPPTPDLAIQSVYQPAREVGGDFFQVLPDPRDGSTLIVVGDVAGKGLKAGMLAALIVGAVRTAFEFTSDPGRILALLNQRLVGRGLVTCMAIRIDRNGKVELANAGHLPPYINGKELPVDGALPLGALANASFPATHIQLREGESMLLVSDGVVEARNSSGVLFGFERTRQISNRSAEEIARAAQEYGQEDDITVLTLTRLAGAAKPVQDASSSPIPAQV